MFFMIQLSVLLLLFLFWFAVLVVYSLCNEFVRTQTHVHTRTCIAAQILIHVKLV